MTLFQRGFIVGAALVGTFAAIAVVVMQVTGTAPTSMGALAEQWTASELRPLRRAGWRIVHHFALRKSDIDHVLLGPSGVFAVETKWSARGWMLDPPEYRVLQAVKRVRGSATLLQLWHPLRSLGVGTVEPVLFLWGGIDRDVPSDRSGVQRVDGVVVVAGVREASRWRARVSCDEHQGLLDGAKIRALWSALDDHARRRDEFDRAERPPLPSLVRVYVTGLVVLSVAVAAFLGCLWLFTLASPWWLWGLATLVLTGLGLLGRRNTTLHLYAAGWLTGRAAAVVFVAAVFLDTALA